jgi:YidC/Oxa1 family membrane protein insertase
MTVFIGFMFYKVASGLCLYFIASSLWGIGERKLLPKSQTPDSSTTPSTSSDGGGFGKRSSTKNGANGSPRSKGPRKDKRKK